MARICNYIRCSNPITANGKRRLYCCDTCRIKASYPNCKRKIIDRRGDLENKKIKTLATTSGLFVRNDLLGNFMKSGDRTKKELLMGLH